MMHLIDTMFPAGLAIQQLWDEKRRNTRLAARADFSIDELRPLLGRLILVDILPELDVFYRLYGTRCSELLGQELTGKRLSDLQPPELRTLIRAEYAEVVADRRPMVFRQTRAHGDRGAHVVEHTLLPLSHGGETVDQVLSLADWASNGRPCSTPDKTSRT